MNGRTMPLRAKRSGVATRELLCRSGRIVAGGAARVNSAVK